MIKFSILEKVRAPGRIESNKGLLSDVLRTSRLSLAGRYCEDEEVDARPDEHEGPRHTILLRLLGEVGQTRDDEGGAERNNCETVHCAFLLQGAILYGVVTTEIISFLRF